ncbi:hypothetical protein [Burkholderia sp. JP2-270]|uniref:hypothetical protein n=1 Tax=Burkholderia sp. JP2-270 TaxID=2217913 RepID=UPI0013A6FF13|nr:hypothetical protein [Burkholderia sp. JP2-270]
MQSYVYFAGSDWIDERRVRAHERVRQRQLKGIMKTHKPSNFVVQEDPAYNRISPLDLQSKEWRGDLAVRQIERHDQKGRVFHTRYLFELKIDDAPERKLDWDLYKLASLQRAKRTRGERCRAFLVVLGIGAPSERFEYSGRPRTLASRWMLDVNITYQTRGIFTAAPVGSEDDAHYACLVEVTT